MGQCSSSQEKPAWIDGYFKEETHSYIEAVTATGSSEEEARNKAAQIAIERRSLATGQRVTVEVQNGSFVVCGGDELTVKARIIDEYREYCTNGYRVSLLIQTAKHPDFQLESIQVTDSYPFSPRVFIPGMAQIYKGNTGKGIFFISGHAVLIGGIVLTESLRASNESKIASTRNITLRQVRQDYINNANRYADIRNGLIAGAVVLYAWNVIDGWVSKGKKYVQVFANVDMRLSPFYAPNFGSGIMVAFKF
jgi:hypothetical protein